MKIIFISVHFPPISDGVGDYTFYLSEKLRNAGHEVKVVSSPTQTGRDNQSRVDLEIRKWNMSAISPILKFAKQEKPDLLIFQYVPYSYSGIGTPFWLCILFTFLKARGLKVAITFHEVAIRLSFLNIKHLFVGLSQRLIAYYMTICSDAVITSIDKYVDMLSFIKPVHKIPVGNNIAPANDQATVKNEFQGEFIICSYANRLSLPLIEAFGMFSERYPARLVLLGKNTNRKHEKFQEKIKKEKLSEKVHFTGYLSSSDLYQLLSSADIYLQLEKIEKKNQGGLSLKSGAFASACHAGLPIIATAGDMTENRLLTSGCVHFIKPATKEEIAKALFYLYEHKEIREKLSFRSKAFSRNVLDWDLITKNYIGVIEKVSN